MNTKEVWGLLGALFVVGFLVVPSWATIPYTPVPFGNTPVIGPGLIPPSHVRGKEYSHDFDVDTAPAGPFADPEQVIAWDGIGGAADGLDYSGTRPTYAPDDQVDAIANRRDALFNRLLDDRAHLIFSHDDMISTYPVPPPIGGAAFTPGTVVPPTGPITLSGGSTIGGAGELSYEIAGAFAPPSTQGLWAADTDINGMPTPRDVDGVEVWGPEPALTADADKYSLDFDAASGTSVWNLSGSPYVSQLAIAAAVTGLLGPVGSGVLPFPTFIDGDAAINVDALMVQDSIGDEDSFDRDPAGGPGDRIIFSIRQMPDTTDPDGYYATGSELFVLDASGAAGFLFHGGHLWDHTYALTDLVLPAALTNGYGVIDINAIEAVSESAIPEPGGLALMLLASVSLAALRRRRHA